MRSWESYESVDTVKKLNELPVTSVVIVFTFRDDGGGGGGVGPSEFLEQLLHKKAEKINWKSSMRFMQVQF